MVEDSSLYTPAKSKCLEIVLGWAVLFGIQLMTVGCEPTENDVAKKRGMNTGSSPESVSRELEQDWNEQMAAVRSGEQDEIVIEHKPVNDDHLAKVAELAQLRKIAVRADGVTIKGLRSLARLPRLEHLVLRKTPVDDEGLAVLAKIPTLRFLNLPHATFTNRGLKELVALSHLELLRFGSLHVTDEGMASLASLPSLRFLHLIEVPITDAGLRSIARLEKLESFYLDGSRVTDDGKSWLVKKRRDLHVHFDQRHHDLDPRRLDHEH